MAKSVNLSFGRLSVRIGALLVGLLASVQFACSGALAQDSGEQSASVNRPIRDKWALVIGISQFQNNKLNLGYSAKDARDFAGYLVSDAGFAADHVHLLVDSEATQRRILSELGNKWLPHVANPDDLVLIFLSTHGSGSDLDIGGQNYLIAYDTDVDDLYTTGISMQKLASDIKERVHCDRVVVFLDACHSGGAAHPQGAKGLLRTGVDSSQLAIGSGQMVIASSKDDQISWESKDKPNGVFTATLLDILRASGGKENLGDVFNSLKNKVQNTVLRERGVLQTPVMSSSWNGKALSIGSAPVDRQPGLTVAFTDTNSDAGAEPNRVESTVNTPLLAPASLTLVSSEPVSTKLLIVPGLSVGRMQLGMSSATVKSLLGKPTVESGTVFTYWTKDRKLFLCVQFQDDKVSAVAFTSPLFRTQSGISLANFQNYNSYFESKTICGKNALSLKESGLIVLPGTQPVAILSKGEPTSLDFLPGQAVVLAPAPKTTTAPNTVAPDTVERSNHNLIRPGEFLARARLGMTRESFLAAMGKPTSDKGELLVYSTGDRKYFLAARFNKGKLSDVGFNSKAFATAEGLSVETVRQSSFQKLFNISAEAANKDYQRYDLKGGGLTFLVPGHGGRATGWLHAKAEAGDAAWLFSLFQ